MRKNTDTASASDAQMKAKKTKQLESGDHNYRELESVQTIVVLENKMLRLLLLRHFSRVPLCVTP